MSYFLKSSSEETFRLLMDFLTEKHVKLLSFIEPASILAEIGSWFSFSFGKAKGEVEAIVLKRKGGSYVEFRFSFQNEYGMGAVIAFWLSIGLFILFSYLGILNIYRIDLLYVTTVILLLVISITILTILNVSITKKRFLEEFKMFSHIRPIKEQ